MIADSGKKPASRALEHSRPAFPRTFAVSQFHTRALTVVLSLLSLVLVGGCERGDECEAGEFRCVGDVALNCRLQVDDAHYYYWGDSQCGAGLCQADSSSAFCTLSATPIPSCKANSQLACDGSSVVTCHSGYAVGKVDCTSNELSTSSTSAETAYWLSQLHVTRESAFCIPNGDKAFCAAEAQPNANCDTNHRSYPGEEWSSGACDGHDSLACVNGYVVGHESCDGLCIVDAVKSYCALSPDPDPNCPLSDQGTQHCQGNTLVGCSSTGYRISDEACATGTTCIALSRCSATDPDCTATEAACIQNDRLNSGAQSG